MNSAKSNEWSKMREFGRIRDLLNAASRPASAAPTSNDVHDNDDIGHSTFLYDIREPDSLIGDELNFSVYKTEFIALGSGIPARSSLGVQSNPQVRLLACGSQTLPLSELEELENVKSTLVPRLEGDMAAAETRCFSAETKCRCILTRLTNAILFEEVIGRLHDSFDSRTFHLTVDPKSIDIYLVPSDIDAYDSFPLGSTSVKVSARQGELSIYHQKIHKATIQVNNMNRFKKILYVFRLSDIPVSLVDIPQDISKRPEGDTCNPRRHVVRDQ